jgi:flagellar basal-body rod modification protein FlgD
MSVSAIDQIRSTIPSATDTSSSDDPSSLDKDDFLQLLVTQMQQQDPLNPQDPTEFMAQLTQYSSLEQMINLNSGMDSLMSMQFLNSQIASANYVGKTAKIDGDALWVQSGTANKVYIDLPRDSASTTLKIKDASGVTVRTIDLGALGNGETAYVWDGKNDSGAQVADGRYSFEVTSVDGNDTTITPETSFEGRVSAISYENGNILLRVNGESWDISDMIEISES